VSFVEIPSGLCCSQEHSYECTESLYKSNIEEHLKGIRCGQNGKKVADMITRTNMMDGVGDGLPDSEYQADEEDAEEFDRVDYLRSLAECKNDFLALFIFRSAKSTRFRSNVFSW
jgi:hypothetical protein